MELSTRALDDVFELAQRVSKSNIKLKKAAEILHEVHGIKESSGKMTLTSVGHLLNGEVYKRAITIQIVEYVLSRVNRDSGVAGLRKSLAGLSAHIDYRNSGNVSVPGLETVLAKFSR